MAQSSSMSQPVYPYPLQRPPDPEGHSLADVHFPWSLSNVAQRAFHRASDACDAFGTQLFASAQCVYPAAHLPARTTGQAGMRCSVAWIQCMDSFVWQAEWRASDKTVPHFSDDAHDTTAMHVPRRRQPTKCSLHARPQLGLVCVDSRTPGVQGSAWAASPRTPAPKEKALHWVSVQATAPGLNS